MLRYEEVETKGGGLVTITDNDTDDLGRPLAMITICRPIPKPGERVWRIHVTEKTPEFVTLTLTQLKGTTFEDEIRSREIAEEKAATKWTEELEAEAKASESQEGG
jgi:hypothetical protein